MMSLYQRLIMISFSFENYISFKQVTIETINKSQDFRKLFKKSY